MKEQKIPSKTVRHYTKRTLQWDAPLPLLETERDGGVRAPRARDYWQVTKPDCDLK